MNRIADAPLSLTIKLLPQQVRRRYAAEFDADLLALPRGQRLPYAVSTLLGAPRLRWEALTSLAGGATPMCFLGRHLDRRIHTESADATVFALECRRCHRIRDPRQRDKRTDQAGIGRTTFGGI